MTDDMDTMKGCKKATNLSVALCIFFFFRHYQPASEVSSRNLTFDASIS